MILLLLGFWDLFAVMTPMGPLRWLVDLVHEKGTPLPGLLFQADIVDAHVDPSTEARCSGSGDIASIEAVQGEAGAKDPQKQRLSAPASTTDQDDDDEAYDDKTIKLGLGDFIFYSVLVARAAMHGMAVFAACFLCVLVVRSSASFRSWTCTCTLHVTLTYPQLTVW